MRRPPGALGPPQAPESTDANETPAAQSGGGFFDLPTGGGGKQTPVRGGGGLDLAGLSMGSSAAGGGGSGGGGGMFGGLSVKSTPTPARDAPAIGSADAAGANTSSFGFMSTPSAAPSVAAQETPGAGPGKSGFGFLGGGGGSTGVSSTPVATASAAASTSSSGLALLKLRPCPRQVNGPSQPREQPQPLRATKIHLWLQQVLPHLKVEHPSDGHHGPGSYHCWEIAQEEKESGIWASGAALLCKKCRPPKLKGRERLPCLHNLAQGSEP